MSRSKRKTPIMGHTSCRSEKQDKKLWHKCWRSKQRMALRSPHLLDLEAISPILEDEVSNVWAMGKDGKRYFALYWQKDLADFFAKRRSKNQSEKIKLEKRYLHQFMAK
ncbi:hypothetical protein [Alysiella crassa]|uniref:Uncharacterized protein n=1 Tax=Alysiella crassa TaxID=153491 RepID=A0A376BND5_9NEIS|nr:hypothetical protein [Alysiella crassa]UOP06713.1 hypothetical protein LVJ80_13445 [Alysiella crassa]SSY71180.1 Uncharacterised protein [Alysiella crassa]